MWKFCHACGKCADYCPNGSISKDKEPSWDVGTYNGKPGIFHAPGPKHFWCDAAGCRLQRKLLGGACHICYAECTFNEGKEAMVHNLVKATVATTSIFNGFFANMSDAFGYGARDKEGWWDESLPIMGTLSETYAKYR
jgi:ferredoxin